MTMIREAVPRAEGDVVRDNIRVHYLNVREAAVFSMSGGAPSHLLLAAEAGEGFGVHRSCRRSP
jgi:hypothetical protein